VRITRLKVARGRLVRPCPRALAVWAKKTAIQAPPILSGEWRG